MPNIRWSTQLAQIAAGKYVAGAEPTSGDPWAVNLRSQLYRLGMHSHQPGQSSAANADLTFPTAGFDEEGPAA